MRNILMYAAATAAILFLFLYLGYSFYELLTHPHSESAEVIEGMRKMKN